MATKLEDAPAQSDGPARRESGILCSINFTTSSRATCRGSTGNDILKRIALQLYQLAQFSWKAKVMTQEFRLVYEKYAVYTRLFAKNFYLVVFMEKNLEASDFRQPLTFRSWSSIVLCVRKMSLNRIAPWPRWPNWRRIR